MLLVSDVGRVADDRVHWGQRAPDLIWRWYVEEVLDDQRRRETVGSEGLSGSRDAFVLGIDPKDLPVELLPFRPSGNQVSAGSVEEDRLTAGRIENSRPWIFVNGPRSQIVRDRRRREERPAGFAGSRLIARSYCHASKRTFVSGGYSTGCGSGRSRAPLAIS